MSNQTGAKLFAIPHPGTGEWMYCETFEEAMEKWYEGFNVPRKLTVEPFDESLKRLKEYHNNKTVRNP